MNFLARFPMFCALINVFIISFFARVRDGFISDLVSKWGVCFGVREVCLLKLTNSITVFCLLRHVSCEEGNIALQRGTFIIIWLGNIYQGWNMWFYVMTKCYARIILKYNNARYILYSYIYVKIQAISKDQLNQQTIQSGFNLIENIYI